MLVIRVIDERIASQDHSNDYATDDKIVQIFYRSCLM
jgi:hypothetical protein